MGTLRTRIAVLVAAVSLVILGAAGAAILWAVQQRMHDAVREEAVRAADRARISAEAGATLEPMPRVGEPTVRVLEHSPSGDRSPSLQVDDLARSIEGLAPGEVVVERREVDGAPAYVAATVIARPGGNLTAVAVAPLVATERMLSALRTSTAIAVPVLAALLGGLAAVVVGRVLRPVAVMRAEADAISHGTLHRRLTPAARSVELAELADTMNDMLGRLERAATGQRQLLSDVSHELRSPLATVRGTVEVATREPPTIAETGPTALAEIDRLDRLVGELLTLSRLDEPGGLRFEDVDLDDVVAEHAAAIRRPGLQVDTGSVRHVRASADRRAVDSLVRNVLDNAARHATTAVQISLRQDGDDAVLLVDDDGTGVPASQRARVFERFTRLDEGRARDAGGTGLGLAVAAAAAGAHAGSIDVGDAPIGGARFTIRLPIAATIRPLR